MIKSGVFTPSGWITVHPNEVTRFVADHHIPNVAATFGVPVPARIEPLAIPQNTNPVVRRSALLGFS